MASVDTGQEASGGSRGSRIRQASQDFELNLAPIIDCMVVLIAFLLVSLSYLSIHMIDAGVSRSAVGLKSEEAKPTLVLRIEQSGEIRMEATQAGPGFAKRSVLQSELRQALTSAKESLPKLESASLSAADSVPYETVVAVMDEVRLVLPSIQLGGF